MFEGGCVVGVVWGRRAVEGKEGRKEWRCVWECGRLEMVCLEFCVVMSDHFTTQPCSWNLTQIALTHHWIFSR